MLFVLCAGDPGLPYHGIHRPIPATLPAPRILTRPARDGSLQQIEGIHPTAERAQQAENTQTTCHYPKGVRH